MGKALLGLALMLAICGAALARSTALAPLNPVESPVPDQYIVVFKESTDFATDSVAVSDITGVDIEHEFTHVFKGVSVRLTNPDALTRIQTLSFVKFVEEDGIMWINGTAGAWGLDRVNQRQLPLDGKSHFNGDGQGVNVYIIDTGIYPEHEYFGGRARVGYDAVGDGQWGIDCHGHGTHCAGTIGAEHYGIARAANLWGVRVLSCDGWGYTSWVIGGMEWVAAYAELPAVASMSLGGGKSEAQDLAVKALYDAGVTVSVAAGNSNYDACYYGPANSPLAITAGATDKDDVRAYFSNYGECVDIFAPGVNVLSTFIGSPTATYTASGTSMACPHVSGAVAIALGNDRKLTPKQVWEKLKADSTSGVVQDKGQLSPDRLLFIP